MLRDEIEKIIIKKDPRQIKNNQKNEGHI